MRRSVRVSRDGAELLSKLKDAANQQKTGTKGEPVTSPCDISVTSRCRLSH